MIAAELDDKLGEDPTLDLFAEPETERGVAVLGERAKRRPGRPPGARNKFNERALAWLRAKYPDARERLLAIGTANTADMAALWGCSMLEAEQEQRACLGLVLPFVAQKQPISINLDSKTAVYLVIDDGTRDGQSHGPIDVTPQVLDIEEIQALSKGNQTDD